MDVISRLDERAAAMAARQIDQEFGKAGKSAGQSAGKALESEVTTAGKSAGAAGGKAMADEIDKATKRAGDSIVGGFASRGMSAGRNFGTSFGSSLAQSIPGVSGFASAMSGYDGAAGKVGAVAGRALGMAFTTAAAGIIGAAGYTLFKGFERYKTIDAAKNRLENLNRVLENTGKATLNVERVMDTVNDVVEGTRFSLSDAFNISTQALSAPTGDLKRFMSVVADAAQFTGKSIGDVGQAFINIANQGSVGMEEFSNQLSGIPLTWLQEELGVTGAELQKLFRDNKVGLDDLMKAVERNAQGFAKGGVNTVEGAIEQLNTAVARLGANFLGAIFGQPTDDSNDLASALSNLKERLDDVNAWVTAHRDDIKDMFDTAVDVAGDFIGVLADIGSWLADNKSVAYALGGVFTTAFAASKLAGFITSLQTINTLLGGTAAAGGAAGSGILGKVAALSTATVGASVFAGDAIADQIEGVDRPWYWPIQRGVTAPGRIWDQVWGNQDPVMPGVNPSGALNDLLLPGGNAPTPLLPGQGLKWEDGKGWVMLDGSLPPFMADGGPGPAGSDILAAPGLSDDSASKKKGPRLPDAPVVPYDTTLPAGPAGLPMTAAIFSAESSYLDSRHKLTEKRARLAQLEQSADATEQDRLNARNDVIEAERDFQASEMRLNEARTSALEKSNKQLKGLTKDLGEIGASLDADFGISKGLAGIAENLTKFVANLAAAPLLGQLAATSAMAPTQGGHGLMGILGAQGVFGSMYQNNQYAEAAQGQASASAMGPAAWQPGAYPTATVGGGQPYGLPGGTAINYGQSDRFPPWVRQLEQMFGVQASTYSGHQEGHRGEAGYAPNPQGQNRGIDWSGPVENMQALADYLATIPGAMEQVIWQNPKTGRATEIAGGRPQPGYFSSDLGGHQDHVHTRQSQSIPLPGAAATYAPASYTTAAPTSYTPTAPTTPGPGNFGTGTGAGFPGMGGPPQAGGVPQFGTPQPATRIGGVAPTPGAGGGGGFGIQSGGLIDMGIQAGAMGLDMMAPGAGQAAAMGMKLANRGIEYAGQVAGIGVSGLMETFLPTGGSELANNNWLTRIAGGIAGAAPALPNLAGGSEPPLDGSQTQQQGQQGQAGNTYRDINVTTNREDGAAQGRDIAYHLQAQHAGPGM